MRLRFFTSHLYFRFFISYRGDFHKGKVVLNFFKLTYIYGKYSKQFEKRKNVEKKERNIILKTAYIKEKFFERFL